MGSKTPNERYVSRRTIICGITTAMVYITGCLELRTNPRNDNTSETGINNSSDLPEGGFEEECTFASISNFTWEQSIGGDRFIGTLINRGDIAGEVKIQIEFYTEENSEEITGTVDEWVAIGAQETKEVVITANPPTQNSQWAIMKVEEQDCRLDFGD